MKDIEAISSIVRVNMSLCIACLENDYKNKKLPVSACTFCKHKEKIECLFDKCAEEILKVVPMLDIVRKKKE